MPFEFPDDPPKGGQGGGPAIGVIGGGGTGGTGGSFDNLFGGGGFGAWNPSYTGLGSGVPFKRRWKYLPGAQGGQTQANPVPFVPQMSVAPGNFNPGGGGNMFAGMGGNALTTTTERLYGPGGPRPYVPPPGASNPKPGYQTGSADTGYVDSNGTFVLPAFLKDIASGHYFDQQNDVLSQLLDQRGAANERAALLGANSEFSGDPSLQGFARMQARINSGRDRTQGLLAAKKSQQDWVNELYRALGMGEYGHKLGKDMYYSTKPKDASDFEKFMASLGGVMPGVNIGFGGG